MKLTRENNGTLTRTEDVKPRLLRRTCTRQPYRIGKNIEGTKNASNEYFSFPWGKVNNMVR
jgi:hypothetical protein